MSLCFGRRRQPFQITVKVGVIDLYEISAVERIDASLDLWQSLPIASRSAAVHGQ
jgi:hypothetical protein